MKIPFMGNELLRGTLVYLTRPNEDDIKTIAQWSTDIMYQRLLRRGMVYPGSIEEHQGWFADMLKGEEMIPFSARRIEDDHLVGMLVIKDIFWQARHCSFFIGIGDPEVRGRGYGPDAVRVLLKYAFLEMNLNRVGLEVLNYNEQAIRAYKKVGFRHEGILRAYAFRDGVYYDMHIMGILRSEWEQIYDQPSITYPPPTSLGEG
jgi:RimJ/RimL family protein N-acetyltransferase